jgi:hypothetical protein
MHSVFIVKIGLEWIENKFWITSLYLNEILNSVISLQCLFKLIILINFLLILIFMIDNYQKIGITRSLNGYHKVLICIWNSAHVKTLLVVFANGKQHFHKKSQVAVLEISACYEILLKTSWFLIWKSLVAMKFYSSIM